MWDISCLKQKNTVINISNSIKLLRKLSLLCYDLLERQRKGGRGDVYKRQLLRPEALSVQADGLVVFDHASPVDPPDCIDVYKRQYLNKVTKDIVVLG